MRFYWPYAFIYLISIPIIILFYLLKQQYSEQKVSSLYLWQEAVKELEASTPWQKLKKNLLMILQITGALLMVFALSDPFITTGGKGAKNVVIVIDTSMSMQAVDVKPSRFEAAKKLALDYLEKLEPDAQVTLISMGSEAVLEENMSRDKSRISGKLKGLAVTNGREDFEGVLRIINSLWEIDPDTKVVFFSDYHYEAGSENDSMHENIELITVNGKGANYAITLMSHTTLEDGSISLLTVISNFSDKDETLPLSLYVDGKVADAREVRVKARDKTNVYWNKISGSARTLECRIEKKDPLEADNRAWTVINRSEKAKVLLITQGNQFLERFLKLVDNVDLYKGSVEDINELKGFDLYVLDGDSIPVDKLPHDGNIIIFNPRPSDIIPVKGEVAFPTFEKSEHEVFEYVKDYDFSIYKSKVFNVPAWGEEVLASNEGTLAFAGELDKRRILVFGFDLHNTDMVLKTAFPIVMTNAMEWLLPPAVKNIGTIYPGQEIEFALNPKTEEAIVKTPSGEAIKIAPPFPPAVFDITGELGVYIIEQRISPLRNDSLSQGNTLLAYFAVNAPAEQESDLYGNKNINLNISPGRTRDNTGKSYEAGKELGANVGDGTNSGGNNGGKKDPILAGGIKEVLLWLVILLLCVVWWVYANGY